MSVTLPSMIEVRHVTGCAGFQPASGGWIACSCWRIGYDENGDLVIDGRGVHEPDEIEDVMARTRAAFTSFAQSIAQPVNVQSFRP